MQLVKVLYCKLPTNGKQMLAFPHDVWKDSNSDLRGGRRVCYLYATIYRNTLYLFTQVSVLIEFLP